MAPSAPPSPGFLRAVSRWELVMLSVNAVVGSGVYLVLPVSAARLLGPASVWAILAGGGAVLLIVLCFAEAASLFDQAGGAYLYSRAAFGELVGFEVGWMSWIARIAAVASLTMFFPRVLGYIWEGANHGVGLAAIAVAELSILTWINVRGVKAGARAAVFLTLGKTLPLAMLVIVGVFSISWNRIFPVPAPDASHFGAAALLVLYSYAGFESTPAAAGEYQNPRRNLPLALLTQLALVTSLYTLVQLVAVGTLPDLGLSKTPLSDAGRLLMGPAGGLLLTVGAALSVLGTNNGTILGGPRGLYALAESGRLPSALARVHPRYRTPYVAILTQSGIALGLIGIDAVLHRMKPGALGVAEELALISVIGRLATYIGTCLAVPVLRRKFPATPRTIRLPGGPSIPLAAFAVCLLLLSAVETRVWVVGGIALAAGAGLFFWPRSAGTDSRSATGS